MSSAPLAAESFLPRYDDELTAVVVLLLTGVVVVLLNRVISSRGRRLAAAVSGGELRPEVDTRLRFLQRLLDVLIVIVGLSIALRPFTAVGNVASAVLTSGAIAAAVVGFAARQTLANVIAGILLAVTQPLRIGDVVTFEGETGTVEDVRLASTWLRTPGGTRVIVPNERLAAGVLRNDSMGGPTVAVEPSVWLNREVDPLAAVDVLRDHLGADIGVRLAETTVEGTRVLLLGPQAAPRDRAPSEHVLRERALRALRDAGVTTKGEVGTDVEEGSRPTPG